jgi:hypothetical protein
LSRGIRCAIKWHHTREFCPLCTFLGLNCIGRELVVSFDEFGNHRSSKEYESGQQGKRGFSAQQSHNALSSLDGMLAAFVVIHSFLPSFLPSL